MDNTKLKGRMSGKVQELQQPTGNQTITVTLCAGNPSGPGGFHLSGPDQQRPGHHSG